MIKALKKYFKTKRELRRENTILRADNMTLERKRNSLKGFYEDKLKELRRDKEIQENNNTKLINENMIYKNVIEKLENAKSGKEMKKILADFRVQLISFYKK